MKRDRQHPVANVGELATQHARHDPEPVAVRRETAARMLDCSPTTVWRLCKEGQLQTVKVGSDQRVLVASIRALATVEAKAA